MHLDWQAILLSLGGLVTGIGAVQMFLHKWLPITKKYLALAATSIAFLDNLAVSLQDDNLSAAEWDALKVQAINLSNAWKSLKS